MSVWIVLGWEESYGNWEVLSVLFDAAEVDARVEEIFTEFMDYESVKVEHWHRDDRQIEFVCNYLGRIHRTF